jgi:hypothetical protein
MLRQHPASCFIRVTLKPVASLTAFTTGHESRPPRQLASLGDALTMLAPPALPPEMQFVPSQLAL